MDNNTPADFLIHCQVCSNKINGYINKKGEVIIYERSTKTKRERS